MASIKQIKNNIRRLKQYQAWKDSTRTGDLSNSFTYVKGRMFERWIDSVSGSARSNGFNVDGLIQNPAYIIESLLRDENFVERDLKITTVTDTTHIIIDKLISSEDNYYNYAIYYNVTTNFKTYITDYDGGTKELVLASADTSASADDDVYITNVRGDNKINYASFDAIGNTTNGTRKDWLFDRCYTEKDNIRNILDELLYESHCELTEVANPDTGETLIKIIALDDSTGDTWTNPSYDRNSGLEQSSGSLTSLDEVFTSFRLKYFYDYGSGNYLKELFVDKNGFPSSATILSATEQGLCEDAETNYLVSKIFEYESKNIYDTETAERFLQKKIQWHTKQHLILNWNTQLTGSVDFIKYEVGDFIKLNFSKSVPTGFNNSEYFIITSKKIVPLTGGGNINWTLMEI